MFSIYFYVIVLSKVRNGHIKRITDDDIQSLVVEILGTNVSTTYILCPENPKKTLGIKLPFLVMIIKNMKKYFTFEVQVLDDKNVKRRFRASNYQSTTRVKPFICTMPMRLDDGWNQIQFNLSDFTRRAYGTNYIETLRVQIHANCRIRVCISPTGCILKTNYPLNSNSTCRFKTRPSNRNANSNSGFF
ncbi:UPF0468 protein C16orf80-like protein [Apostichopus japonicus]|uniref:UPF0468 protein C16orf80-like protein n=1 Tax=Stichopus japonicus TaxID=307972 RepID=A0A2G8KGE4_STIJA|nr:UPF0468 protein C16orf80-like protein [Apostichopus japonicus]